jgi:rifampicin phosphotransferase
MESEAMELVLDSPELTNPEVVGHKFARQAIMRSQGFPVPEFFCVPADASFAAPPDPPAPAKPSASSIEDWAKRRRAAIIARGVPQPLAAAIEDGFDRLVGRHGHAAVRACVVGARHPGDQGEENADEDGAGDPFAGMSDSFLYVGRADVVRRVAECWASAYNAHAVRYRLHRGVALDVVRVAVGVQRMAEAHRSFVVFTRDPRNGADRRVIGAAYGIGEGVVQERADIDHFFVDPQNGTIEAAVTVKARMIALDPGQPDAGPRAVAVPGDLAGEPVLSGDEIRSICALAERAEGLFGQPQDIEGTVTTGGEIHLVQARPLVLPAAPQAGTMWTNHNLTESFPGVTCTLTHSQAVQFYELGFADFYRRMGVPAHRLAEQRPMLRRMVHRVDGRMYYWLNAWYELHGMLPAFAYLRPTWQRSLGLTGQELADAPPMRRSLSGLVRAAPRIAWLLATHPWRVSRFLSWWDSLIARTGEFNGHDETELVSAYRRLWSDFGERWGLTLVNSYFLLVSLTAVQNLLKRWVRNAGPALLPDLLHGGRENRSIAAVRSMLSVAESMRDQPALRAALRERDDRDVFSELMAGDYGEALPVILREHLRRYGDRTLHDLKLEARTPRQEPWLVLGMLRPLVEQDMTAADSRADEHRVRQAADRRLRESAGPVRRAVLKAALAALRYQIRVREDTRFCRSQLYGLSRDIIWRLGARLAADGRVEAAQDVIHLTVEEVLGGVADSSAKGTDLRGLVIERRADLQAWATSPEPPPYICTRAEGSLETSPAAARPPAACPSETDSRTLIGLGSSSGVVRARARVVLDPNIVADDHQDHILVARETDPGWLYMIMAAKGLVVERGSLLSHTAITGRLLGIPAVVAVQNATTNIPDGCLIEVDGSAGTVRLLSDETAGEAIA